MPETRKRNFAFDGPEREKLSEQFSKNVLENYYNEGTPSATLISAQNARILRDLFPDISAAINQQYLPSAEAQLKTADPTAATMTELYRKYGPQLNQIGSDIARQNALAEAETNKMLLSGSGRDATLAALDLDQLVNPEFYSTRAATGNSLNDLLASIDLSGGLSDVERREIEQGLAREGTARGTANAPSNTETIANAMRYGQAGRERQVENQNQLAKAIAASTAFLPASQSGINTFAVGTGKTSGPNTGESRFTGVQQPNFGYTAGLGGNVFETANQDYLAALDIQSQKKDWLDKFVQFSEGLSNIGKAVGSVAGAGACWIAREVYGEDNPRWKEFRAWLLTKAPEAFRNLYLRYGAAFAEYIKNKPELKIEIRNWMDERLNYVA